MRVRVAFVIGSLSSQHVLVQCLFKDMAFGFMCTYYDNHCFSYRYPSYGSVSCLLAQHSYTFVTNIPLLFYYELELDLI